LSRHIRDRVRQLRVFCTVARLGGVTRAAEHLGLSQPAASLQIRELERELGAALFERTHARMVPTAAGEWLVSLAGPPIDTVDALFGDFRRVLDEAEPAPVCIAATSAGVTGVLPRYVRRFRDRCPGATVRIETVPVGALREHLLEEKVDLALGPGDAGPDERLHYHEMSACEHVLITALDHPLAGRASVSPREAGAWRMVVPSAGTCGRRLGEGLAQALDIDIDVAVEVDGWGMLKRYVEAGAGISVVPRLVVRDSDRLSVVALDADLPAYGFGVFTLRDGLLAAPARRFFEVLVLDRVRLDGRHGQGGHGQSSA